ncbi:competence/damage-inducible protein A [Albibacterium profundi]|uniref:CinA-like protein n=1 Tax=Albibacterium profundi TaxID=3134906 RepID=A0ABV5CGQ8_9SPHI
MNAELLVIGDEILIGQIVDTNSSWICAHLGDIGVNVTHISVVSDDTQDIKGALSLAASRSGVIIMTGGLGPTKDDVTKDALIEYFDTELVVDKDVLIHVEEIFAKYKRVMPPENMQQAEVLANAEVMFNRAGTAPGMWIKKDDIFYAVLPGVPTEMKYLMTHEVIPRLADMHGREVHVHKTILTAGIGESFLAATIAPIEAALPNYIHLAYLPTYGQVRLRLSTSEGHHYDLSELEAQVNKYADAIKALIPEYYINDTEDTLQHTLLKRTERLGYTIAAAESCTGGYFSHLVTTVPGSGQVFLGSIVSYAEAVKEAELDVKAETIERYTAVSEQTAVEMVLGVKKRLKSDYAVSITGYAGPDGGTEENPVGTVWIAVTGLSKTVSTKFLFGKRREDNIIRAATSALYMLYRLISEENL